MVFKPFVGWIQAWLLAYPLLVAFFIAFLQVAHFGETINSWSCKIRWRLKTIEHRLISAATQTQYVSGHISSMLNVKPFDLFLEAWSSLWKYTKPLVWKRGCNTQRESERWCGTLLLGSMPMRIRGSELATVRSPNPLQTKTCTWSLLALPTCRKYLITPYSQLIWFETSIA